VNLTEFLQEETILLNMRPRDKWDAIRTLAELFVQKGQLPQGKFKPVLDALIAREKAVSTGMEHGVALPHASVEILDHPLASLGIVPDGVNFQSQDNQPAKLLMLLAIPKKSLQIHIRTLAAVAHLLNFEEMRQALLSARSAQEVLRIIREEEQKEPASR
jgi:mannitol/fructose-specific phosphotransferase system IIA component (Ntr-type)